MNEYYVYVYIDPRNFEDFYYGKGKGVRKDFHKLEAENSKNPNSKKLNRIKQIQLVGLEPIVRVIARNLSENDALLVEKTLLWKLGKQLTNISTGHFKDQFRPNETMYFDLPGYDFQNSIYYHLVGENKFRNWDDFSQFGFISNGQEVSYVNKMKKFNVGDIFAAFLPKNGFVGIGRITEKAKPINQVHVNTKPLLDNNLICKGMTTNIKSSKLCEHVAKVDWIRKTSRNNAKKVTGIPGLYHQAQTRASLDNQPKTIEFLEKEFKIKFEDYINKNNL